jgi:hypothetical protein
LTPSLTALRPLPGGPAAALSRGLSATQPVLPSRALHCPQLLGFQRVNWGEEGYKESKMEDIFVLL